LLLWNTDKNPQPGGDRFVSCRVAKNPELLTYPPVLMSGSASSVGRS
jgi:hypothetical protein